MAYRLKSVRYQNSNRKILLQNENGPCPLLAAANALLLKGVISLPSHCIRGGVASIDDVVNLLAERALKAESEHHLHELMEIFPNLQYGMDVNPKFTAGVTGVEYTTNLTAFDMMNVHLVHGWLLDPQDTETHDLIGSKTYNELIELVVKGREAAAEAERLSKEISKQEHRLKELAAGDEKKDDGNDQEQGDGTSWVNVSENDAPVAEQGDDAVVVEKTMAEATEVTNTEVSKTEVTENAEIKSQEIKNDDSTKNAEKEDRTSEKEEGEEPPNAEIKSQEIKNDESKETAEKEDSTSEKEEGEGPKKPETDEKDGEKEESETMAEEDISDPETIEAKLEELRKKVHDLSSLASEGALIDGFLSSSSHQLTHFGLHELYAYLEEESLCVFFRNNHFATLTKHSGVLYLLVTDLGYANVPEVMWEKLDGIDGDTEYVNSLFVKPAAQADMIATGPNLNPEQMLAQREQSEADYQLAIQLSKHGGDALPHKQLDEQEGKLVAAATEASLREYNGISTEKEKAEDVPHVGVPLVTNENAALEDQDRIIAMQLQAQMEREDPSERLARELQAKENQNQRPAANRRAQQTRPANSTTSASSNCVIS